MAKYKVLSRFRDKNTKEVYEVDSEIELTVKRAEEVEGRLGAILERLDNKKQVAEDNTPEKDGKEKAE